MNYLNIPQKLLLLTALLTLVGWS